MVKSLESSVLKDMSLLDLKKHAKQLRRAGYPISGYSKFSESDIKELRKMIRHAQRAGKSGGSCDPGFENLTHCQKKTSAKKVKQLAEDCDIDLKTKPEQCKALIKKQGSKSSKKKKTPSSNIKQTDAYKKLNKLKKKDNDKEDLQDKARKLKITYADQDGENITMGRLRKHELILAILAKKGKTTSPKKTPTPVKKSKKKSKKKTPSPKTSKSPRRKKKTPTPKKSKKKSKKKTPTPKKSKKKSKKKTPTPKKSKKTPTPKKSKKKKKKTPTPKKSKKKKKKTPTPKKKKGPIPDPWSTEGLARKQLINQVSLATGRSKSFYKDWSADELRERLEGLEVEGEMMLAKSEEQAKADEAEARRIMIKDIVSVTGESPSVYKNYTFDQVMDKISSLQEDESIVEQEDEPTPTPTPVSSDDDSSEEEPTPTPKSKKKTPTPVSSEDDDSSEEESDRPDEGAEVVDVESTLANVIAGGKKIGELAKVQKSILKCMGLLS